jgi:hypothetical protein
MPTQQAVVIDTPLGIKLYTMSAQIAALYLETKGLSRHGRSVYSLVKQQYLLKGNKQSVLEQLKQLRAETWRAANPSQPTCFHGERWENACIGCARQMSPSVAARHGFDAKRAKRWKKYGPLLTTRGEL